MPRVLSIEMLDESILEDDDTDPFDAPPSAFQYLPPPVFTGRVGDVYVPVRPAQVGSHKNAPTEMDKWTAEKYPDQYSREQEEIAREHSVAATVAGSLAALGAISVYCRYDGGNDEGFAWFVHCDFKDGVRRDAKQMRQDLTQSGIVQILIAAGHRDALTGFGRRDPVEDLLDHWVANAWASELLGRGFGTGEYTMYGAFSVDLETGLITDDPQPAPVVANISLKQE